MRPPRAPAVVVSQLGRAWAVCPKGLARADLSLRGYVALEAKEAQKWLWQARCAFAWRRLISADKGRFGDLGGFRPLAGGGG